jgi:hypothetical protein
MFDHYRELENSLHEVSKWVGRIVKVLSPNGSPAPETYLSAMRGIRALQEEWSLHLEIERVLFPRLLCRNLLSAEFLERITARNQAIEKQLEAILSAPWPRSPQAGLQSLRTGVRHVLTPLLVQIEGERALILPATPGMDRREPVAVRSEPITSERIATEGRLPGRELVTSGNPPLFTSMTN